MRPKKQKVFVGMSGGVDSSVSAALLVEQGYDVTGVFIKAWHPEWAPCDWKDDRRDAMRVCARLDIPFITLDLEKEYKQEVVDYMVREYSAGRTPNPDVMCNKYVKFGGFLKYARESGADFVATGHYAIKEEYRIQNDEKEEIRYTLNSSADAEKDQTYFLWTLTQDQLKHILFPIGHLKKDEVRKLAQKFDLPNATKKDSQGLCFVGKVDMKEFLSHFIERNKGDVLDTEGNVIGTHDGTMFLTIGQRHGFQVTNMKDAEAPLYVIEKNMEHNTVTVSPREPKSGSQLGSKGFNTTSVHWIDKLPNDSTKYLVRLRYRQRLIEAKVYAASHNCFIELDEIIFDIASGQSFVVYYDDVCMGGGIIES